MIGPGARLRAPVLDDLDVLGRARGARVREGVARPREQRGDQRRSTSWSGRCSPGGATTVRQLPAARAPSSETWASPRSRLARLGLGADDVEREVLEHPDADAVTRRLDAVAALAVVLDRLGGQPEAVAMERAIDHRRDPPAGDRRPCGARRARPARPQATPARAGRDRRRRGAASARRRSGRRGRSTDAVVGGSSVPAELARDRGGRDVGHAARIDEVEGVQVRGHVQRDAVERHAALDADARGRRSCAGRSSSSGSHPAAGMAVPPAGMRRRARRRSRSSRPRAPGPVASRTGLGGSTPRSGMRPAGPARGTSPRRRARRG